MNTTDAGKTDLVAALHEILTEGRAKRDEHAAGLREYEINGDVPVHLYPAYDETRATNALDAAEFLDTVLARLAELVRTDTAAAPDPDDPALGTEYVYPLSDYARETARVLREKSGEEWGAESGFLGAWGLIYTPDGRTLRLYVDDTGGLVLTETDTSVAFPPVHHVPTINAPDRAPRTPEELRVWAECIAATVREHYGA